MDIPTESYQIIQMHGNFQNEFLHGIPIEKKVKEIIWITIITMKTNGVYFHMEVIQSHN